MKRVLEDEIISLAQRILKMKNRSDIHQLKKEAALLYDKLAILSFAEKHFGGIQPDVSKQEFSKAYSSQFNDIDEDSGHFKSPDGTEYNPEPISEPNTEKIKDIVSQMPVESEQVDMILAEFQRLRDENNANSEQKKQTPKTEDSENLTEKPSTETESKDANKAEKPSTLSEHKTENTEESEKPSPKKKEEQGNYPTEDDFNSFGVHYDDLPDFEPKPEDENKDSSKTESEQNSSPETPPTQNQPDIFSQQSESEKKSQASDSAEEKSSPEQHSETKQKPQEPEQIQTKINSLSPDKRSLNDQLKKGIKIGLNDRIAFTKHLFDGNVDDYNRVLSQLNTMSSYDEAKRFLDHQIKPDYNNWEDKEATEERFLEILQNKFD
ncbi:hypothetical protein [Psychroflexus aestuariivivens]|uniref:hypothetical protein n=1 Tax=Psychroflexus aestuariivivens TaxID=1795040 RepID=UPI000FDAB6F2|nr:hypothetical protein [Psychroflexus aestuariivivens]